MTTFDTMQQQIRENTKRQAALIGLCIKGCIWLSDDGICVSSTGCMYTKKEENSATNT